MKNIFIVLLFITLTLNATAQSKASSAGLCSGNYEEVKLSIDSVSKTLTGIIEDTEGRFSCAIFFSGKLIKDKEGNYKIKAFPFGDIDTTSNYGTLSFRQGKKGHDNEIQIKLSETGSCQNIMDLKIGVLFSLDKKVNYHKFSMVRSKKAIGFGTASPVAAKKGYLLQGDFVSILNDDKDFAYVEYLKKTSYKAWVKKSDLVL